MKTMSSPISQEIGAFLQKQLNQTRPGLTLEPDTPLLDSGYFNSLELYNLIVFIEERYSVEVNEDQIVLENFRDLQAIEALIQRLQAG
jgi:acyl carrier protein